MKALLDTSTLIAAMLPDHVHHAHALAWLSRAKSGAFEFVGSAHSLAEIYAVLTRLPRTPPIGPTDNRCQFTRTTGVSSGFHGRGSGNHSVSVFSSAAATS
jgi:predicted nucleic acid-binding protein